MDARLARKITDLVKEGISSTREIINSLLMFVKHDLFKNEDVPALSNRRFFPVDKDIRSHFYRAFVQNRLAKIDQENLKLMVDDLKKANDYGNVFFRPYIAGSCNTLHTFSDAQDETSVPAIRCKQTMLFVYQNVWQQHLLCRYGQEMFLLDATYKTTKYALPLFFLCVKTNFDYQVVACFATQNERACDIAEALYMIKSWCPQWNPSHCMTDKCDAEIQAVEEVLRGCFALLMCEKCYWPDKNCCNQYV